MHVIFVFVGQCVIWSVISYKVFAWMRDREIRRQNRRNFEAATTRFITKDGHV
jgi:hypothetical protein